MNKNENIENRQNIENKREDQSQGINSMNYGSPISMFNPHNKAYTPTLGSGAKETHDNMTLEELISKIDNKRNMIKRSVREEMEGYFGVRQSTPQFTESVTSQFLQNTTNDQASVNFPYMSGHVQAEDKGKQIKISII